LTNENGIQTAGAERRSADRFAAAVVALFFVVCVCYSLCTPRWLYADEPFHYYYIKAIMHEGRLPTHTESYEAAHPPLYYLAATAWSLPFKEKYAGFLDNWIRLLSALMGAATVFVIYRIGRDCLDAPWLGAGMAVFAAANPVLAVTGSVISNDIAVILASNTAMYLMLRMCRNGGAVKTDAICGAAAGVC